MNETNVASKQVAKASERIDPAAESTANEIRLLSEMELVLAGGGDSDPSWP